ncbi:hypothetical protein [Nitrobacter sp. Nb-311A]|nr:hypothetical protein [Nitrobacter sp. Nb-311A]
MKGSEEQVLSRWTIVDPEGLRWSPRVSGYVSDAKDGSAPALLHTRE